MIKSTVYVSMRDSNGLNYSYAVIDKLGIRVIIILNDLDCGVFDYEALTKTGNDYHYLLLKHYRSDSLAYTDFLKLIGKMCK